MPISIQFQGWYATYHVYSESYGIDDVRSYNWFCNEDDPQAVPVRIIVEYNAYGSFSPKVWTRRFNFARLWIRV